MRWILFCVIAAAAAAQPEFDVATIRPSNLSRAVGEGAARTRMEVEPTGIAFHFIDLSHAIQWAHRVKFYQISGGPEWIWQDRYEITAKVDKPVSTDQLRLMLQSLLAKRFQLTLHREPRTQTVFALVAPKHAVNIPESTQAAGMGVVAGSFVFRHVTMPDLAEHLSELLALDRVVLDETGIPGVYDVTLHNGTQATRDDPSPIFDALAQLGLELRTRKSAIDTLVIDRAEKPKQE